MEPLSDVYEAQEGIMKKAQLVSMQRTPWATQKEAASKLQGTGRHGVLAV